MSTEQNRPAAGQSTDQQHERPSGAESPHNLLAVHDPSKGHAASRQHAAGRAHGVRVEWLRPNELAVRIAGRSVAAAVTAHLAAHRQLRARVRTRAAGEERGRRERLAPVSAFGSRRAAAEAMAAERPVVGR